MNEKVVLHLQIAARNLPLEVPESETQLVEQAAELLNEKIEAMSGSALSLENRLLITALELAGDIIRQQRQREQNQGEQSRSARSLQESLDAMQAQLEQAVRSSGTAEEVPDRD